MRASHTDVEQVERILSAVDPRLQKALRAELRNSGPTPRFAADRHWVLAGHRAAGKSRLLPLVAAALRRAPVELDVRISEGFARPLREWIRSDEPSFRRAERDAFLALPPRQLVAVGGGFLSLHPELLAGHEVILVPVTFETYRERLLADESRPRLLPALSVEDELRELFDRRETLHQQTPTRSLAELLRMLLSKAGERGEG